MSNIDRIRGLCEKAARLKEFYKMLCLPISFTSAKRRTFWANHDCTTPNFKHYMVDYIVAEEDFTLN